MNSKKDLSIIIPHYNSIDLLKILLNSIPKRENIEIIVIDDRSTEDGYKKLSMDKNYNHVRFLMNKTEKKGAGVCRNIGLKYATGKWLLFADSDDFFVKDFYSKIKKYFDTEYDVIFFKPISQFLDTKKVADRHIYYENLINNYVNNPNKKNELNLKFKFVVPWSKMIKRTIVVKYNIKFDEVLASNDIMFSTKVGFYLKSFTVDDEHIYCVTRNKGSLTVNTSEQILDTRIDVFINYYKFLKNKLDKKSFKLLQLKGTSLLILVLKSNLGFKKLLKVYKKLKKNKIRVIDINFINPFFIFEKIIFHIKSTKINKKYFVKD